MKTSRKVLFGGILGAMIVAGLFVNFALSAPGAAPSSTAGCVQQPNGQFTSNGRVCDRVDYTLFKVGLIPYVNPYFYHLLAEGWQFLNYSRGGSFFTFETHNLITGAGVVAIQNDLHGTATGTDCASSASGCTTFVVQGLGLSYNAGSLTPAWNDETLVGTYPTAGPCSNDPTNGEISQFSSDYAGGLSRTVGTFTAGTVAQNGVSPNGGTISPYLTATWTATSSVTGVSVGCAWLQDVTGAGIGTGTLFAENTFSSVNMNAGDQLTITWTFTYSG